METTAATVRTHIEGLPERSFVRIRDFTDAGSYESVAKALARLVDDGELARVRTGLYWRGPTTRFGMVRPTRLEIAIEIAGDGAGPAGVSAARVFGLTTQVPSTEVVAVPGRSPAGPIPGIRFASRPAIRAAERLSPTEVAAVEVLRTGSSGIETTWEVAAGRLRACVESGAIRASKIRSVVISERFPAARDRWSGVEAGVVSASA